jgi:hypothetical protein
MQHPYYDPANYTPLDDHRTMVAINQSGMAVSLRTTVTSQLFDGVRRMVWLSLALSTVRRLTCGAVVARAKNGTIAAASNPRKAAGRGALIS